MFNYFQAIEKNRIVARFGVDYLDEALCGIMRGDLVLIGSRSGAGKSTIANMIARSNQGTSKVSLFSLENFEDDLFVERAYRYFLKKSDIYCSLREFASGNILKRFERNPEKLSEITKILGEASKYAENSFAGIRIYNRQSDFGVEAMVKAMESEADNGTELIIIDHLDYIDKDYSNESDIEHISLIMRTIRDIQDKKKIAVVAISHLRKPLQSKDLPIIPSDNEFIGSSNKVKESTVVIVLAPDDEANKKNVEAGFSRIKRTWCCIRKNRLGGISNTAANLYFDCETGEYKKTYDLFSVNYSGTKAELIRNVDGGDL